MHQFLLVLFLLLLSSSAPLSCSTEWILTLVLPVGEFIEGSPGSELTCNRVRIHGYSRLHHWYKYANALKIKLTVSRGDASRFQSMELCFHRNASIDMGMCPASQWQKLTENNWSQSISPYEHQILDIRMLQDSSKTLELTTSEEFLLHRVIFLIVGVIMMLLAHKLSKSLVFYYCGAMTIGTILMVSFVLFQAMKLTTGRRNSLEIFMYSSIVGGATLLLRYLSELVQALLFETGPGEDLHTLFGTFILVGFLLVGAWFGYWSVCKLDLTEEGLVDSNIALILSNGLS